MAASILKIGISRNANCDNLVGFPKSGHIYILHALFCWQGQVATCPVRATIAYVVHLANIKFGELECKANWRTFGLAIRTILSIDSLSDTHNARELVYIKFGNWIRNRQATILKSPPNVPCMRYLLLVGFSIRASVRMANYWVQVSHTCWLLYKHGYLDRSYTANPLQCFACNIASYCCIIMFSKTDIVKII